MKTTKEYPVLVCDLCNTEAEFEGMMFMAKCAECGKDLCHDCAVILRRGHLKAVFCCPEHLSDRINEQLILDEN